MALPLIPIPQTRTQFGFCNFSGLIADQALNVVFSSPDGWLTTMKGVNKRMKIFFEDVETKIPYDPAEIKIRALDETGVELQLFGGGTSVEGVYTNDNLGDVKRERPGVYYYDFTDVSEDKKRFQLMWRYKNITDGEELLGMEYLTVLSNMVYPYFPRLKNQIDKARKIVGMDNIGYTEGNLHFYLQGGLDEINTFPPVTAFFIENWPIRFGQLLIDSATLVAMYSQNLFSIDTDVPSYSDQGFSFPMDHYSKLSSFLNAMTQKVKDNLKMMKMEFASIGSIHVLVSPATPIVLMINAAPGGSLFRNLFVA